jgi:hypothetical protein
VPGNGDFSRRGGGMPHAMPHDLGALHKYVNGNIAMQHN